jgi:hypothetical protein
MDEQVEAAVAWMHRKPDAIKALELIEDLTDDPNVLAVIHAFCEAREERED